MVGLDVGSPLGRGLSDFLDVRFLGILLANILQALAEKSKSSQEFAVMQRWRLGNEGCFGRLVPIKKAEEMGESG